MQKPAAIGLVPPDASGGPGGGVRRTRGANKAPAWRWDGPVPVIRLPLAVDERTATRLESLFFAMFCLKRTVQREARSRTEAFWAGARRREADAAAWRREVGLTRPDLARAAYAHLDASGWLRHHATKALALHQADEVWTGVERHLFPDASGKRAGRPRTGSWWEYTRIPGRARSHTAARKVDGPVLADQITLTDLERAAVERERRTARRRARSLERSRRANNKARYELSRRQRGRQERRQAAGLPERQVGLPKGPRLADAAGRPLTSHRKDRLTGGYRALRTRTRVRQAGRTQAKRARAQAVAERITAAHGVRLTVEDGPVSSWFRLWGRACAVFTPGMLWACSGRGCKEPWPSQPPPAPTPPEQAAAGGEAAAAPKGRPLLGRFRNARGADPGPGPSTGPTGQTPPGTGLFQPL